MDNKELPQEIMNEIIGLAIREIDLGYHDGSELPAFADGLGKGAQIAQSHYEPQLQSKDTTIKEQAEKIEKLMGLLKERYMDSIDDYYLYSGDKQKSWNSYKEQHGI